MLRRQSSIGNLGLLALLSLFLLTGSVSAQTPTGSISGRVTDGTGQPLAAVAVTLESASLQGSQKIETSRSGEYLFKLLPPGRYTVSFSMPAFAKAVRVLDVAALEPVTLDATLQPATVTEAVTVSADADAFVGTIENATNLKQSLIQSLPSTRTMLAAVALAPAVHATGPDGAYSFAGAMSFENAYLVNGVRTQDNLRGSPFNLFIEDAIQETTVSTSAVSAEYGGFLGGLVNTLTKSGGNTLSGSFRTSFTNDNWRTVSPFGEPKVNKTVPSYEYTLGGPIVRDRVWFFGAGRFTDQRLARQTGYTNVAYEYGNNEKRYEGKITGAFNPFHRLSVGYTAVRQEEMNSAYPSSALIMDLASLTTRQVPQDLVSANYAGTFGARLFLEAQFSARAMTFKNDGGQEPDRVLGTPLQDQTTGAYWWAPNFCGVCVNEQRNNNSLVVKGTYFLSGGAAGSHTLTAGYDTFNDQMTSDNHQSASDYHVWATGSLVDNDVVYPVIDPGYSTYIIHWPLVAASRGTNYRTHSLFANDNWTINRRLSASLGVRFDKNAGKDASGQLVANDSEISPRFGIAWDVAGNGRTTVTASAGRYVTHVSNSIASSGTGAGTPSIFAYFYQGPGINTGAGPLVPSDEALRRVFAWYDQNQPDPFYVEIPGVARKVNGSLRSPHADYYTVGLGQQFGANGSIRVDYVTRTFGNFYAVRADQSTGMVEDAFGQPFDLKLIENTNDVVRDYRALDVQGRYRAGTRLNIGASYTLSKLSGNIDGENSGSGPVASSVLSYPEYFQKAWRFPEGDLSADQRHRARIWATYALPSMAIGDISFGVIQQAQSGTPYGAIGGVVVSPFVQDPGYVLAPDTNSYFFTRRDEFRTESLYKTDLSLNFTRRLGLGSELFAQFQVFNLFNQFQTHFVSDINTTVLTALDDSDRFQFFDPFTETPDKGVHWDYGDKFGEPIGKDAYTQPRTYRFSAGIRF